MQKARCDFRLRFLKIATSILHVTVWREVATQKLILSFKIADLNCLLSYKLLENQYFDLTKFSKSGDFCKMQ